MTTFPFSCIKLLKWGKHNYNHVFQQNWGKKTRFPAFSSPRPWRTNTLFSTEETLKWPRKEVLIRAHRVKSQASQLSALAAVGRQDTGNTPTERLSLHSSELGGTGMPRSAHTYKTDHGHHKTLVTRWTLKIDSLYLWAGLLPWPPPPFLCRYSASFYCLFAHCFPVTHARKTSYLCVLFCSGISNKGMYSLPFFCSR